MLGRGWRFGWQGHGAPGQIQRLSAVWEERHAEQEPRQASGTVLPGVHTKPHTSLPGRHDLILSVNSIFFSGMKNIQIKRRKSGLPKSPSKAYESLFRVQ